MHSKLLWTPLPQGMLKWNINASMNSKSEPYGIEGVLRYHEGKFICIFFYSTCIRESNETEVLAIQKAFFFNTNCCYIFFKDWIVESNSYNTITWIRESNSKRLWWLQDDFNDIFNACLRLSPVILTHIHNKSNHVANHLARQGVHR